MKKIYISDDGKMFDTKKECFEYEKKINDFYKEINDNYLAFDEKGSLIEQPINYNLEDVDIVNDFFDFTENVDYLFFKNKKTNEFIIDCLEQCGCICNFNDNDTFDALYYYDSDNNDVIIKDENGHYLNDGYIPLDYLQMRLEKKLSEIKNIRKIANEKWQEREDNYGE